MNISVKFVNFENKDVVATSCPALYASLAVVEYDQLKFDYYYFNYEDDYTSLYGDVDRFDYQLYKTDGSIDKAGDSIGDLGLESGKKYHFAYDGTNWKFYPCVSGHDLASTNPFPDEYE